MVTESRPLDEFDPVTAFRVISLNGEGFILDGKSPEPGADRYVYVGSGDCQRLMVSCDENPAAALRKRLADLQLSEDGKRFPFMSGAVGYFSYEAIRHFEPSVGELPADPINLPTAAFFLPGEFLVYDRREKLLTAVVLAEPGSSLEAQRDAKELLEAAVESQRRLDAESTFRSADFNSSSPSTDVAASLVYQQRVRKAKYEIERGELIQVVLSQRVIRRTEASPLDVYHALSELNPSPYMFMLNFGDFAVVGCSPELMVRSRGREVSMHPIAGTHPRDADPEQDTATEAHMVASEKERAEHVMLVDLARNDLGRVSQPGTVHVGSFMATERYSHVMHLVSRVKGQLKAGADGLDAFVTGFPLGTLTGAPRLRAVELIAELEPEGRGPYCGGVGWFDASGDVDTGTVIRCIVMKDGEAHIQGGGGVVFDSDPEREYLESVQKMAAQFEAIDLAEGGAVTGSIVAGS